MSLDDLRSYVAEVERRVSGDQDPDWVTPAPPIPRRSVEDLIDQVSAHTQIGQREEGTRFGGLKRSVLRVLQVITRDQNAFNAATADALRSLAAERDADRTETARLTSASTLATTALHAALESRFEDLERAETRLDDLRHAMSKDQAAMSATIDQQQADLETRLDDSRNAMSATINQQRVDIARLSQELVLATESIRSLDDRLTLLLREARARLPGPLQPDQLETFNQQLGQRFDALYTEFENRYRGSREEIIARLEKYTDFLDLSMLADRGVVIDIGCGRGEWLELMKRHGVDAYGVDVNDNIAQLAVQRGLEVKVEDGLEHLSELRSASAGLVSMFHVAEHLEFETLFAVVRAAHHALAPGGALLVETPNPTNLNVGAASFYRDPTHKTPLHPQLLEFLVSSAGFDSIELKFLHPSSEVPFQLPASLKDDEELKRLLDHVNWALLGPQDYSIIAFKSPLQ